MSEGTRADALQRAVRLSVASVAWNAAAGIASTVVGLLIGSLALLGFGLDSVIDGAASCVLIWRFLSEGRDAARAEALERRSTKVVGIALMLIGVYVGARAIIALMSNDRPGTIAIGVVIAAASVVVLPPLALAKRRTAAALSSHALRGDSLLTLMGASLAAAALLGIAAARLFGWWWADSAVAIGIALVLEREGVALLRVR